MKYILPSSSLFIQNRSKFVSHLKPGSLALFVSNDLLPTNADGTLGFRQNSDLFYLTGIPQEETILLLFPDAKDKRFSEVLFIRHTNPEIAQWEGQKLTKEKAREISGIQTIYWYHEFDKILQTIIYQAENIYLNHNEHTRRYIFTPTMQDVFNKKIREKYPLHTYLRSAPIMHKIRSIKNVEEIEMIQKACNITELGFRRLLKFIKPGVWEFEIEAELAHEFIRNRSDGFAYQPIIASGKNACVLHYNENDAQCNDGELVLLDVGALYGPYASDLTRVVPVNGKFTPRQKAVYNAVLNVKKFAEKRLVAGNTFEKYNREVGEAMTEELLKLGLLKTDEVKNQNPDWPAYKKYFMHGTSHFLGLDVHDVGLFHEPMQAGMVFTCEPGIYIPEEGIGIRLEDDILITTNGNQNLMKNIPIEADEIEALMN
ncbi:MAG: aminopeptidase P N-terminal domain-containing protein [Bacteroidia bacterium]|nr:aminopeptidase P N-terminal domain-containing protein [Bacteroidia bacterium]